MKINEITSKQNSTSSPSYTVPPVGNPNDMVQFVIGRLIQTKDTKTGYVPTECLTDAEQKTGLKYPVGRRKPGLVDVMVNGSQLYNVIESFPTSLLQSPVDHDMYLINMMGSNIDDMKRIEGLNGKSNFTAMPLSMSHKALLPKKVSVPGGEPDKQYVTREDMKDGNITGKDAMSLKDLIGKGSASLVAPQDLRKDIPNVSQALMAQPRVTVNHDQAEMMDADGNGVSINNGTIYVNGKFKVNGVPTNPCPITGIEVKDNPLAMLFPSTVVVPQLGKFVSISPIKKVLDIIKSVSKIINTKG